jgi:hypothetical protein
VEREGWRLNRSIGCVQLGDDLRRSVGRIDGDEILIDVFLPRPRATTAGRDA